MQRITIAVAPAHRDDANAWARSLGEGPDDGPAFGEAGFADAAGRLYAVASGRFSESFPSRAQAPLVEPPWGADMAAAGRAQALLSLGAAAAPGIIAAVIEEDPQVALTMLGLTRVEIEAPLE